MIYNTNPKRPYFTSSHGDCDGCGKHRVLTRINWCGTDTDQCWECRGVETEEDEIDVAELFES